MGTEWLGSSSAGDEDEKCVVVSKASSKPHAPRPAPRLAVARPEKKKGYHLNYANAGQLNILHI
jgi:hypothetical protein